MSATEIIEQIKGLPPAERAQVAKFVVEQDDSWIPESFKQGMADAEAGRFADMELVLNDAPPPSRQPGQCNIVSNPLKRFGETFMV